jgi:mycobactin peptide synthetase MbtE
VLQRDAIDPDENFFDLGGNSVLLASASHRLSERLQRPTAVTDIFRFPTLRQLAAHYNEKNGDAQGALGNSQDRGLERRARRQQRRVKTS